MPTLIAPPRQTPDIEALLKAACAAGWSTHRLTSWRAPAELAAGNPVLYGEPLFADVVAGSLGIALLQPPPDWLPALPERYRQRSVTLTTLDRARQITDPAFIKPAADKCFPAQVYPDGAALPTPGALPDDTLTLITRWNARDGQRGYVTRFQVRQCLWSATAAMPSSGRPPKS
ncbi:MAG: ATP-grasp domain-containing protein [Chloroflexales bacterium]|nr:ATP-grasp domain-containing protein [Chloroflexales bacterium]